MVEIENKPNEEKEKIKNNFSRTKFGVIITSNYKATTYLGKLIHSANGLVKMAVLQGKILGIYTKFKNTRSVCGKNGFKVVHELYDVSEDGNKCIVCVRKMEASKYGFCTRLKTYYLLSVRGKGISVKVAPKTRVARFSKAAIDPGEVIKKCLEVMKKN